MAQFVNTDGMNCASPEQPRTVLTSTNTNEETTPHQPNIRHIPIFVEGRDEPLINNIIEPNTNKTSRPTPIINDLPKTESIFTRVKDIPVRKDIKMGNTSSASIPRTVSPGRSVPINVIHAKTQKDSSPEQYEKHNEQKHSAPPPGPVDPIEKIQKIQQEVLCLMNRVEKYPGGSRNDKEYMYLDEMLTQNLLKLDTIDTEGKDNIKQARKEAIKCINKCISVLEAKTESAAKIDGTISEPNESQKNENENIQQINEEENSDSHNTTNMIINPNEQSCKNLVDEQGPTQNVS